MHIVGFLVVDVHVGAAHVDEGQLVLVHIVLPFRHIALIANGIDLKDLVAGSRQRVIENLQLCGLFLAVVAVGVPEPQHHVLLRQGVARNPVLGVFRLVGVGHRQFLSHSAYKRFAEEVDGLALVVNLTVRSPFAFACQIVVSDQVDEHLIPAYVLGVALVFGQCELHKVAQHRAVVHHFVEQLLGIFGGCVGVLVVEYVEEIEVHLVVQMGRVDERMVLQVDIVPIVGAIVFGLPFAQVGVAAAGGKLLRYIDVGEHLHKLCETILLVGVQIVVFKTLHLVRQGLHLVVGLSLLCRVLALFVDALRFLIGPVKLCHISVHQLVGLRASDFHTCVALLLVEGDAEGAAVVDHKVKNLLLLVVEQRVDAGVKLPLAGKNHRAALGLGRILDNESVAEVLAYIVLAVGERRRAERHLVVVLSLNSACQGEHQAA